MRPQHTGPIAGPIKQARGWQVFPSPDDPLAIYCLKITCLSLLAASALQGLAIALFQALNVKVASGPEQLFRPMDWAGTVLFAPLAESVLLWAAASLARSTGRVWATSLVIGVVAGGAHAALHPMWFFGPAASFTIFAWAWQRWRNADRPRHFLVLLIPHVLQNAIVIGLQFFAARF